LGGVIDTQANNVTLNGGLTSTLNNPGTASAVVVTKKGTGTLTLAGTSNFAGGLTASAGHMLVNGTVSGLDTLTIGSTATVELGGSFRFNSNTNLTLGGGTLATDGFSENLGAFNLSGNVPSAIDLGNGSSVLTLAAATLQSNWSGTLVIYNWSGSVAGGGTDQVVFGTSASGLTASEVSKITFSNPDGYAPGNYSAQILSTGEVVAVVPEPGSFALALCGGLALAARRRRAAKVR
jgi:autotransporter-associated beta strand protein